MCMWCASSCAPGGPVARGEPMIVHAVEVVDLFLCTCCAWHTWCALGVHWCTCKHAIYHLGYMVYRHAPLNVVPQTDAQQACDACRLPFATVQAHAWYHEPQWNHFSVSACMCVCMHAFTCIWFMCANTWTCTSTPPLFTCLPPCSL